MKNIVMDLDHTICVPLANEDQTLDYSFKYSNAIPDLAVIEKIRWYKNQGFNITIFTSRNMRTFEGDLDAIRSNTLPIIIEWLDRHEVPYDNVIVGKPWCGTEGFYVDDRAVRPSEFKSLKYEQIMDLMVRDASNILVDSEGGK